jgi:hypothetical protein
MGQHIMQDTAACLVKSAGLAMPAEAPRQAGPAPAPPSARRSLHSSG